MLNCIQQRRKKTVPLINQLKSHLELAGIIVLIESSTTNYTEVNLINKIDSHKIDTVIYCLPESDPNRINFKECNYKSEKLFALKYIEFNYHENYYFTVLEILTKLLPGFPLENAIQAFKKEYESLYEPVSIINKPNTIKVNPLETEKHSKNKILMNLKNKKKWVYAACTLSLMPFFAWLLTYNIQSHEYNATQKSKFNNGNVVDANNNNITDFALQPNPAITLNWNLPPQHHQFIGREDLLETIDKVFRPSTQQTMSEVNQSKTKHEHAPLAISVLAGLGGVGKTQLALEYIHHSKHPYKLKSWFSAENLEQLKQQYIEFAKFLGYKEQKMEINMALAYIKKTLMDYKDWILVYDNVNNYDELKDYLPEGNGNIILTTRQRNWPSTFQIINIDVMTEAESIELIKSLTKNEITKNEMTNAKELVNTLGYLPLALAQAGSYIQQNSISIQEYLELYKKHESDLLLDTAAPEGTNSLAVEITWNITLDAIIKDPYIDEKQSALALHLLSVCSYLAPEEIPRTFLLSWLKEAHPELPSPELILTKLIGKLWQYSMISKNSNGDITIHPLVQAVLRHQHKQALTKKDSHYPKLTLIWYDVLLKSIHTEFHRSTTPLENEARKRALHPHLQWLLKNYEILWNKESARSHIGDVICDIGDITFDQMFNTKVAKLYYERGLPLQKQLYGENHPQIAYTLRNLGTVYRKLGDYQKAKVLFEQALEIQEHHYGQNHPNIAPILTSLGFAHRLFGNFEEANIFLKRALAIQEENYGKDHPEVAIILECLGIVDYKMEYYDQAKLKFERALKILESHYKTDHPTIGYVLRNLGHTYAISGNPKSAMDLLEKALKNQRRYCNDNSPEIAFTLRDLGLAYGLNGNYKQGTEALEHALRVQEDIYGKNHPEVAFTLNYLGIVYAKQKDYKKAEDLVTRAVLIQEKFYGKEHLETKKTLKTLKDITLKVN